MSKKRHGLHRNQRVVVTLESIAGGGHAVTRQPGIPVFVSRGAPEDEVEIELYDVRKDFAHGRIVEILTPSPLRADPPCKLFKVCGGCQWQHLDYPAQVALKTDIVRQAIRHIGGIDPKIVLETLACESALFYRNKVQFPVARTKNSERIIAGYFKEGSHELVNIKHCPVQPEPLDRMLESAKSALERHKIPPYEESSHSGLVRHIAARYSFASSTILVTLVVNADLEEFGFWQAPLLECARELMEAVPEIKGVSCNFNSLRGNRIFGTTTVSLVGDAHIVERLRSRRSDAPPVLAEGLEIRLSPESFFQVNTSQAEVLLDGVLQAVLEWRESSGKDPFVLDAYGGVGTIGLWLSPVCEKVICIEEIDDAVSDGVAIAAANTITNVEFRLGRVEAVLPELVELCGPAGRRPGPDASPENVPFRRPPEIIVLDPPRKGVAAEALDAVVGLSPERIIYVSCNPATLARDLRVLHDKGYQTRSVQPIDMFPQTYHVECIAVVDRSFVT